ncbi:hypothetical protein ONZ43_g6096 [Nemania bipapillata]|uniref:Uncharacterized protein n=1 Tax=Nemania bipapillata TaxID=110536 RepID=A0ACC2I2R8_9PEZI|nr:hypothetical protein ONZ43_g6096 [Nemania bipapillata]
MAPALVTDDYYAVLGVVITADTQAIRAAYRRLARVTHPDKNPSPDGKEQFQRLQAAYETLSDPTKRTQYDFTRPKPSTFSQPWTFGNTQQQGNGSTTAEAASHEAERSSRARVLEKLQAQRARQNMDIFEARRAMRKLEVEISNLQEEDAVEVRVAASQTSWWKNVSSFIFGAAPQESKDIKEERERKRLNRNAAIRIKSTALLSKKNSLSALETAAQSTAIAIDRLKQQIRLDEQRQEAERAAAAQRERWEEMLRRSREAEAEAERERKRQEEEERERKERQQKERERVEREQEELRRRERERVERVQRDLKQAWENSEQRRKERERREQQTKKAADAQKRTSKPQSRPSRSTDGPQDVCLHVGWWDRIPGRTVCSICSETLGKFALQCPHCQMKACAACRRKIQGGRGNVGLGH